MSNDWFIDVYQPTGKSAHNVMGQIELMLESLRSSFLAASSPSSPVGGQPWHDSTARKIRNYANDAWLASLLGDASQKMWVYRNDTCEGWVVDATIADVCLAVKGGSNDYNVNGGNLAGTWTQPDHDHTTGDFTLQITHIPAHYHTYSHLSGAGSVASYGNNIGQVSSNTGSTGGGQAHNHGSTGSSATVDSYRPRAAVGTLQYPDLS